MAGNGGLLKPPASLEPPRYDRVPPDPVGSRPAGETPRGAMDLLWFTLVTMYYHARPLCTTLLFAAGIALCAMTLVILPVWFLLGKTVPNTVWAGFYVAIIIPLLVGYDYVALLVVQGIRPRAREVLLVAESIGRFGNILVAGGFPSLVILMLVELSSLLSPIPSPEDPSLAKWTQTLPYLVASLLMLPLAFAGIDVLAARHNFLAAFARSVGFLRRQPGLFVGLVAINVLESLGSSVVATAFMTASAWQKSHPHTLWSLPLVLALLAAVAAQVIFSAVVHVHFYREFVWREREAEHPPAA